MKNGDLHYCAILPYRSDQDQSLGFRHSYVRACGVLLFVNLFFRVGSQVHQQGTDVRAVLIVNDSADETLMARFDMQWIGSPFS